jgi:hypothetical protein
MALIFSEFLPGLSLEVGPLHRSTSLESRSWEISANATAARLRRAGLLVVRVVRVPYLCQGYLGASGPMVLDGAVFVTRKDGFL